MLLWLLLSPPPPRSLLDWEPPLGRLLQSQNTDTTKLPTSTLEIFSPGSLQAVAKDRKLIQGQMAASGHEAQFSLKAHQFKGVQKESLLHGEQNSGRSTFFFFLSLLFVWSQSNSFPSCRILTKESHLKRTFSLSFSVHPPTGQAHHLYPVPSWSHGRASASWVLWFFSLPLLWQQCLHQNFWRVLPLLQFLYLL